MQQSHAVVTGGGRGIGLAVARSLTATGCRVSILGRSAGPLGAAVAAGDAADHATADITDAAALAGAIAALADRQGPVDILVCNAGGASTAPFAATTAQDFTAMFNLNVLGSVHAIQAVLPGMVARNTGRVICIASTAALKGYGYVSAYVTAKHAVLGLVRALALELARTGITVNAVCPGFTETDLLADSVARIMQTTGRTADAARADLARNNPQRRFIAPDEVAAAVAFLCGDAARSITGASIPVCGGEVM